MIASTPTMTILIAMGESANMKSSGRPALRYGGRTTSLNHKAVKLGKTAWVPDAR
jgi:hypothetical protein